MASPAARHVLHDYRGLEMKERGRVERREILGLELGERFGEDFIEKMLKGLRNEEKADEGGRGFPEIPACFFYVLF